METTHKPRMTPKDFFMQFGALVTLYVSAGAFISLLFTLINRVFPDALDGRNYYTAMSYTAGMRFAVASLVIIFPTYLILLWFINKDSEKNPEKKNLPLRRWLTYVTLFVSAALVLGDLVTLLNYFLGGEITIRFVLKVLTILVVAAGIFLYYIFDLRKPSNARKLYTTFAVASAVLVVAAIVWSFAVMGLPQSQRDAQLDMTRVNDLQSISSQIAFNYQQKNTVPASLSELVDPISNYFIPRDPETKAEYQYERLSATSFKLCADFKTASDESETSIAKPEFLGAENQSWQHEAGNFCFTRTIDPDRYPPIKR